MFPEKAVKLLRVPRRMRCRLYLAICTRSRNDLSFIRHGGVLNINDCRGSDRPACWEHNSLYLSAHKQLAYRTKFEREIAETAKKTIVRLWWRQMQAAGRSSNLISSVNLSRKEPEALVVAVVRATVPSAKSKSMEKNHSAAKPTPQSVKARAMAESRADNMDNTVMAEGDRPSLRQTWARGSAQ